MNDSTTLHTDDPTPDDFDKAWTLAVDIDPANLRQWYENFVDGAELPSALRPGALEECDPVILRATANLCVLIDSDAVTLVCLVALDLDASDPGGLMALRRVAPDARREAWIKAMKRQCRHGHSRLACALRKKRKLCEK